MSKSSFYRITIKMHPAVWRYIDNNYPLVNGSYNLTRSIYYYLVSSMLSQSKVKASSMVCKSYGKYVPVSILVTEFDFYHYGFDVSEVQQCRFSRNILHLILDDACRRIAQAKVSFGIPVTKAIEHYLIDNNYEDNELNSEYIRAIYKRKYKQYERELTEYFRNASTDYGFDDEAVFARKINVEFVPNHFKQ